MSAADKSGAFRNVLAVEDRVVVNEEKQREEQQGSLGSAIQPEGDSNSSSTPASSEGPKASPSTPCATEGGQGGSSGAHGRLLVVEETQVRVGQGRNLDPGTVVMSMYLRASG